MNDLIPEETLWGCIKAVNSDLRRWLYMTRPSRWFVVDDVLFEQLDEMIGPRNTVTTPRCECDVEDFRSHHYVTYREAVSTWIIRVVAPLLCRGIRERVDDGSAIFSTKPTVHFERVGYQVTAYVWMHFRMLDPPVYAVPAVPVPDTRQFRGIRIRRRESA